RRAFWQTFGMRAEEVRADSHQAATENWGLCEFDHLFLVGARLTIGCAFRGSQKAAERLTRRRAYWPTFGLRAENI
ncbi:MAG: hypothetical protein AB1813_23120, partial [Verrucomicrobiota bacterium]